jgi:predicted short-subunit dehydrogenase-like oxidoreductase (DUF2520 family)
MQKIAFIGAGNVAWHLAHAIAKNGYSITEIYSRNIENAVDLASHFADTVPTNSLDFSESEAEIFFVAVSDDALANLLHQLKVPPHTTVAHTSGTLPLAIIPHPQAAVFYPLQTFSKQKVIDFQEIPICLEAKNSDTLAILKKLANIISNRVYEFSSQERQLLHLAAVFSCNFSNFLFTISKHILEKSPQAISFDILQPLINETVQKAFDISPENAQTGPAKRGDNSIIQRQLALLDTLFGENITQLNKGEDRWKKIYELVSEQIKHYYKENYKES